MTEKKIRDKEAEIATKKAAGENTDKLEAELKGLQDKLAEIVKPTKVRSYFSLVCSGLGLGNLEAGTELRNAIDAGVHIYPTGLYLEGYEYKSITRTDAGKTLQDKIFGASRTRVSARL